jgi:hypothetical protein
MEVLKQVQDDEVGLDDGSLKMPFVSSEVERRCVRALAGVSTLTCPERLPWQAAEGLGANGGGLFSFFSAPPQGTGDESFPKALLSRAVHLLKSPRTSWCISTRTNV